MGSKEIEKALVGSVVLSTLALTLAVITIPLLQSQLDGLSNEVYRDMAQFKSSTDEMWEDLITLDSSARDPRDAHTYTFRPTANRKPKKLRRVHMNLRRLHELSFKRRQLANKRARLLALRARQRKWGRKVIVAIRGSKMPRRHRTHAAQTVVVKPGREVFSDAELIGMTDMSNKGKTSKHGKCNIKPSANCPRGPPGKDGPDGEDGENGLTGLPGVDGENQKIPQESEKTCYQCPVGAPGVKGKPGPQGLTGVSGTPGDHGIYVSLPGKRGPPGEPGEDGEVGHQGVRGVPGRSVTRWVCPPGEKGLPGRKGVRGLPGRKGDEGEEGHIGVPGRTGRPGAPGTNGTKGPMGPPGNSGRPGFEQSYCECPHRSPGVRGRFPFPLPLTPGSASDTLEHYPDNLDFNRRLL